MKIEKIVHTLVFVIIGILITQIFLAMVVLELSGNPNSRIGSIASVLTMVSGIILGIFLGKIFEIFTEINFGKMYYRFYSFDKMESLDNDDKISN